MLDQPCTCVRADICSEHAPRALHKRPHHSLTTDQNGPIAKTPIYIVTNPFVFKRKEKRWRYGSKQCSGSVLASASPRNKTCRAAGSAAASGVLTLSRWQPNMGAHKRSKMWPKYGLTVSHR